MLPIVDHRKIRMEAFEKSARYDYPTNYARNVLVDLVLADHTYARSSSLDPEFNRIHSTSLLFTKTPLESHDYDTTEEDIDIEHLEEKEDVKVNYDGNTGKRQMSEIEECFRSMQPDKDWLEDDQFLRVGWTRDQGRLFDQAYKVLSTYRMARCCYEGYPNEQILRSLALDKTAKRFRNLAGANAWDSKMMSWLHTTLVDGMNSYLFICYLELLQTLKAKIPKLIDKMLQYSTPRDDRSAYLSSPNINGCLNKTWDPTPNITSCRLQESIPSSLQDAKLDNKPLVIMLPRAPYVSLSHPKRSKFWQTQLGSVGRVLQVNMMDVENPEDFAASAFLENIIGGTRAKISLFKSRFPGRPVILIGWSVGALLACQIAILEQVAGVVCLGYPSNGIDGVREAETYNVLDIKCPMMFVIGTHSSTCSADFIEGFREKLRVDTRMLLIEGGDEVLKLTSSQKKRMKVTQNMVDRLIMDKVEEFIATVLARSEKVKDLTRPDTPTASNQQLKSADKKRKIKRQESDKTAVEKKKPRISPSQQQKSQASAKTTPGTQDSGKAKSKLKADNNDSIMTPNELTFAATKNLASNASPVARAEESTSTKATSESTGRSQSTKLLVKNPHGKHGEKTTRRSKVAKKPVNLSKPPLTTTKQAASQADYAALQRFPTTSSILLSSSGAHLRLQDGRILRVSNADLHRSQQGTVIPTGAALKYHASANNQLVRSTSTLSIPKADGTVNVNAIASTGSTLQNTASTIQPLLTNSYQPKMYSGLGNLAVTSSNLAVSTSGVKIGPESTKIKADDRQSSIPGSCSQELGSAASTQSSNNMIYRSLSSPKSSMSTPLSCNDLKYLTELFAKGQGDSATSNDTSVANKPPDSPCTVPDSPISARIGIGTLTNLPNADGSPPGSGTRQSPGPKQSPSKGTLKSSATLKVMQQMSIRPTPQSNKTPPVKTTGDLRLSKTSPVTVTIPTLAKRNSLDNSALPNKTQLSKPNAISSSSVSGTLESSAASSNLVNQPRHSKSAVELSQLMRTATLSVTSSTPNIAAGRPASPLVTSTGSAAKLTVTSRQIQGTGNRRNPQTITLHIPNSAMLKEHTNAKSSGSEIKLIGLLNQKGRSPMSSPLHFSVQSKSAPGSPQSQSPTIIFSPKSEPPTPTPNKVVSLEGSVTSANNLQDVGSKTHPANTSTISVSISKNISTNTFPKNGSPGIKICKPANIQTALIKSLTAASFSLKQKESIANLLKNPYLITRKDVSTPSGEKVKEDTMPHMKSTANATESDKGSFKEDKDGGISFVSDHSIPEVVENREDGDGKHVNEVNGYGVKKSLGKEVSQMTVNNVNSVEKDCQLSIRSDVQKCNLGMKEGADVAKVLESVDTVPGRDVKKNSIAMSSDNSDNTQYNTESLSASHKDQKNEKRMREPDIKNDSEEAAPAASKRLHRRGSAPRNGKGDIQNVQKTEE